jgi:hypothetical protein
LNLFSDAFIIQAFAVNIRRLSAQWRRVRSTKTTVMSAHVYLIFRSQSVSV